MESAKALPQPPQSCTKQPATSLSVKNCQKIVSTSTPISISISSQGTRHLPIRSIHFLIQVLHLIAKCFLLAEHHLCCGARQGLWDELSSPASLHRGYAADIKSNNECRESIFLSISRRLGRKGSFIIHVGCPCR